MKDERTNESKRKKEETKDDEDEKRESSTNHQPRFSSSRVRMMRETGMRDLIRSYFEDRRSRDGFEVGGGDGGGVGDVDERVGGEKRDGGGFGGASRSGFWEFDGGSFGEGGLKVGWGGWERTKRREKSAARSSFTFPFLLRERRKES